MISEVDEIISKAIQTKASALSIVNKNLSEFPVLLLNSKELQRNLKILNLSRNKIEIIPPEIKNFQILQTLQLTHNLIKEIPEELTTLSWIETLNLSHNKILSIPDTIKNMSNLVELEIDYNCITQVNTAVIKCPNLEWLVLEGNPHGDLPKEIIGTYKFNIVSGMEKMNEVLPNLFIGPIRAEANMDLKKETGITHILSIESSRSSHPDDFIYKRVDIDDSLKEMRLLTELPECINFIDLALKNGKLLIHCSCGISRSSAVLIGYLMKTKIMKFEDAFIFLRTKRPVSRPNEKFKEELLLWEKSIQF